MTGGARSLAGERSRPEIHRQAWEGTKVRQVPPAGGPVGQLKGFILSGLSALRAEVIY